MTLQGGLQNQCSLKIASTTILKLNQKLTRWFMLVLKRVMMEQKKVVPLCQSPAAVAMI
jgi:hypothetical protein